MRELAGTATEDGVGGPNPRNGRGLGASVGSRLAGAGGEGGLSTSTDKEPNTFTKIIMDIEELI